VKYQANTFILSPPFIPQFFSLTNGLIAFTGK